MRSLAAILLIVSMLYPQTPQEWLPNQYKKEAVQYYDALDQAQWADVHWHVKYYGIRQAIFAGMEGSNRPRGKHGNEDSWQDVGVHYATARLLRSAKGLRDNLRVHAFAAQLSAEIDTDNLAKEYRKHSTRPELNAAMRYPGGSQWKNRLVYGMAFIARQLELEHRLIIAKKN